MDKKSKEKGKEMYVRKGKVIFAKDGRGGYTPKISIPISWLRDMGISASTREIDLEYDEKNKIFFVSKEGRRKDINLTWEYNEENEALILKKKYNVKQENLYRKYWKARNIKIKGYKKLSK